MAVWWSEAFAPAPELQRCRKEQTETNYESSFNTPGHYALDVVTLQE
jgi:hypothetical protein